MSDGRELRPLSHKEARKIPLNLKNVGGPVYTDNPKFIGPLNFKCPYCKTIVAENWNEAGIATILRIDCFHCHKSSTGTDLAAE